MIGGMKGDCDFGENPEMLGIYMPSGNGMPSGQ